MSIFECVKFIYLIFSNSTEKNCASLLLKNNKTLAIAESCTGGLISSLMTDISGSSSYIKANFVTYANEAKMKYLRVKKQTLLDFGAVSSQTASEMAQGLLDETGTDYAIATTGIAGPSGGSVDKPVGLVYIAVASKSKICVHKYNTNPKYPRLLIKYEFAKQAIKHLYTFMRDNNL